MRILIIEDEQGLAAEIKHFLEQDHYKCDLAASMAEAEEHIGINPYDFILLDIGLPDGNGLKLIPKIQQYNNEAYIIIITARGELSDKVDGFNLGADDYLPKPFSLIELNLRLQAIARRKFGHRKHEILFGSFKLNTQKHTLQHQNKFIELTQKEYDILCYLVLNKNRVLDRMQLTEHVWGDFFEDEYDSNYIDVHIKNIRKKLTQHDDTAWIKTIRGVGYQFIMA